MPAVPSATVAAMVTRLLPDDFPALDPAARAGVERDVAAYVAGQIAAMPDFLRLPYRFALLGFALLPLLRFGRPFAALAPARQAACLRWWGAAPLAPMRDVVKLVRSTALLVFFDHPVVRAALDADGGIAAGGRDA